MSSPLCKNASSFLKENGKWKSRLPDDRFKRGQKEGQASRSVVASRVLPSSLPFFLALLFLSSYSHPPRSAVPFLSWDFLPSLHSSSKNLTSDLTRFGPTDILHRGRLFPFLLFTVGEAIRSKCGNLDDWWMDDSMRQKFSDLTLEQLNNLKSFNNLELI